MTIKQLESSISECDTGNSIVHIHKGNLSEEELNAVILKAAQKFCQSVIKQGKGHLLFAKDPSN